MWWVTVTLLWWCGTAAIPSPGSDQWICPEIFQQPLVECSCDMPHTLRCTGDGTALTIITKKLQSLKAASISLLDCTVDNVTELTGPLLEGVSLHGLVISSGEMKLVNPTAFKGLASPLQALGLPNNQLTAVPTAALKSLPELDRLDLSGNRLKILDGGSFKGLRNLSFIDLSDNAITKISPNALDNLPQLKILRLRRNRLSLAAIAKLNPQPTIEELDLSENLLVGPLGSKTFPKMECLKDLQLSHNSLSSIKMGALQGTLNLTTLRIQHNLIDVIEDHAFIHLTTLVTLDLAHNRIVAVSGASLAHLSLLTELDLRHNFLRALTADLIQPLKSLKVLRLDDNDISIIASDALKPNTILKHLTLLENPLNCDCSLIEFGIWLTNSSIPTEDKATAVCTTPPSLENGLLIQISTDSLLCGEEDQDTMVMAPLSSTPYKTKVNLKDIQYDGKEIRLVWHVEDEAIPYSCDTVFIYEEDGANEVLIESFPFKCNSTNMVDPSSLEVTMPISLQIHHNYRYCVALFGANSLDDVSLILGCSDMLPLVQNPVITQNSFIGQVPNVASIQANLSSAGRLSLEILIYPDVITCELNVVILDQSTLLSQKKLPCDQPKYTFIDLTSGPYRVCANVVLDQSKPKCVTVFRKESPKFTMLDIAFVTIFSILCIMIIGLIWCVRKILLKPKLQTHQCFLPPECEEEVQHNRTT
ncbi:leucine-rich repeats and immunoglobulin-like domains protein 1 isoform X2 [Anthonomus grandis grandis]|uniref:leucine-rich repeats and immunoglobulin-like domains protein 1 isoform X2 n=1 Tax=Anthonomus grandis grandis TaxID=2921223 RepID=UPI0021662545|nr:leucine-rich repeats and immunoglobulin-like domains protein 1 isoform X2 [Anthonomus grandis grandis]